MKGYILALDQGTTSCRAILFDRKGSIVNMAQQEFKQFFPKSGWVEHDAEEIWRVQLEVMKQAVQGVEPDSIAGIGITNQRETTVVWDKTTGNPLHPAIVWQCRRSSDACRQLRNEGWSDKIREKTGLVIDPYFSATKLQWMLEHVPGLREKAVSGKALFGTIDSWLVWKLTNGQQHITDYSNASRTMLYNIHSLEWDDDILEKLNIPRIMLPEVKSSSEIYGQTEVLDVPIPIAAMAGDQQAALFGQACYREGMAKNTYGTGCFMLMNTGDRPVKSQEGLLTTIAWGLNGKVSYALEGSVFTAGAVVQWLRDGLGLINHASETDPIAQSVTDSGGVYFVPAFTGLGTPHWNPQARGMITGLNRGTQKCHIVRAALEAIAYQSYDVLSVMERESGISLSELRVDGGAVDNQFLMQYQSDLLGVPVAVPAVQETTALGAAYLAGLAVGFWKDQDELQQLWQQAGSFSAQMEDAVRREKLSGWRQAVSYQL